MSTKRWRDFFCYIARVFILLILLAVLLPKLAFVCNVWISSLLHNDQKPKGNPMRVEAPSWSKSAIKIFPGTQKD